MEVVDQHQAVGELRHPGDIACPGDTRAGNEGVGALDVGRVEPPHRADMVDAQGDDPYPGSGDDEAIVEGERPVGGGGNAPGCPSTAITRRWKLITPSTKAGARGKGTMVAARTNSTTVAAATA